MPGRATWALPLFFVGQTPAASPSSRFSLSGKASSACRARRLPALFFIVQAPAPSSLGHKPLWLCGKKRRFARSSYARQSYMGASAFLLNKVFLIRLADWIGVAFVFSVCGFFVMMVIQFDCFFFAFFFYGTRAL